MIVVDLIGIRKRLKNFCPIWWTIKVNGCFNIYANELKSVVIEISSHSQPNGTPIQKKNDDKSNLIQTKCVLISFRSSCEHNIFHNLHLICSLRARNLIKIYTTFRRIYCESCEIDSEKSFHTLANVINLLIGHC